MKIFTNGSKEIVIKTFGLSDGCDACFTIGNATAYCFKEGTNGK
jgi:hypothetical protein